MYQRNTDYNITVYFSYNIGGNKNVIYRLTDREIQVLCQFGNKLNTPQKAVHGDLPNIITKKYKKMTISLVVFMV